MPPVKAGVGKRAAVVGGKSGRPTIRLSTLGIGISALVDTGASCNLLRRDTLQKIMARNHRPSYIQTAPSLQGVNGLKLDVIGKTMIRLDDIKPAIEVVIVKTLPHEMIIGDASLRKGKAKLDLQQNRMHWFGKQWTLGRHGTQGHDGIGPIAPQTGNARINDLVTRNADIFSAKGEANGECTETALRIQTSSRPICQKAYRTPLNKRCIVEEAIEEMLDDGVIRPSCSPWASPITLVPKKDNTTRFCVDYRRLNAVTEKDTYPLPIIQDIFDQVGGSAVFSTLDLKAGYWQLPVAEEDVYKTAFRCHLGLYEFLKMPFGLANAPAVFQRTMDKILSGLVGYCVFVYLDDIVVYSRNMEDHEHHLQLVFDRLRDAGLRLKPTKCAFGLEEVKLLGYIVGTQGIRTDPEKVTAIANLKPPKTVNEVRSFLGMTGYYRSCVPDYAKTAEPLVSLTRKHIRFDWNDERQRAFDTLKELLTSSHVMTAPDTTKPYKLYTDACDYAVGGILVQKAEDGTEKVVQYISHALSGTQRRWAVIEKEAYAVVYAIKKLRPYLYGARFTVYTDHKPLKSLFTKEMNNTKVQRWGVLLAEYGATIEYRKGKNNIRADMLSRIRHDADENAAVIDTEEWVDPHAIAEDNARESLPLIHDGLNLTEIAIAQRKEFPDEWAKGEDENEDEHDIIKGVLYSTLSPSVMAPSYPRLILPQSARLKVIDRAHKEVGHMAVWKTLERLSEAYVWQGIRRDVRNRLKQCPVCLRHGRRKDHVPMGEMPLATNPMQIIGMDLIGPFAESPAGNRYVFTLIDHCTGWAEAFPLKDKSNKSVWDAFTNLFLPRHGVPEVIISDNGGEFTAIDWERYLQQIGVDHRHTTPVHPQSNGRTERFNRTLKSMLEKLVNNNTANWEDRLGEALLAYRTSVSTIHGHTPFHLMYGRRSRIPLTKALAGNGCNPFGNRLDDLSTALKITRQLTEESRHYNRERLAKKANACEIAVGDSIIVKAEERLTLTSRWDPHWEVTRVRGPVLWIRQQQSGRTRVVNREKVKLVDPTVSWDESRPRPLRVQRRHKAPAQREPESGDREEEPVVPADRAPATAPKRRHPTSASDNPNGTPEVMPERRSIRRCRPSVRAQEASLRNEGEMDVDPEVTYLRKRTGGYMDETEKKRARLEAIALVARFCA